MARTAAGAALTVLHRQQQLALRAAIIRRVMVLYPTWQPSREGSYAAFEDALVLLTRAGSQRSAALAAAYYRLFSAADAPGNAANISANVVLAAPPVEEQIRASISATSRASVYRALGAGMSYEQAMRNGLVGVSGAVGRLSLDGGRDTITEAVQSDAKATGWARVTGDAPCAFCAMLASRGPVYKEETVDFEAHDHCSCSAEPVYRGSEWPGRATQYRDLWDSLATSEQATTLNDFRQALNKTPDAPFKFERP